MTLIGVVLLGLAWISARGIPRAADKDFSRLVNESVGYLSSSPGFPDAYKQMSANARMLQNFYVGAAGLICLGTGLSSWRKQLGSDQAGTSA